MIEFPLSTTEEAVCLQIIEMISLLLSQLRTVLIFVHYKNAKKQNEGIKVYTMLIFYGMACLSLSDVIQL